MLSEATSDAITLSDLYLSRYPYCQGASANTLKGVVFSGLLAEAERRKQVTRLVRDVLVRELAESLPEGWPAVMDDANRFNVAEALGSWFAYTPETHRERADQVMAALRATPPPPGWRPLGPDDELLRALLPDEDA